jgi:putative acetyltransferase
MIEIRTEESKDYAIVKAINDRAFNGENEGILVEAIRNSVYFVPELCLVAVKDGEVIGHILFSIVSIQTEDGDVPTLALAPMAVNPDYQNKGVGSMLVTDGLKRAEQMGYEHVVVLGHPAFYPKFGFIPSVTKGIESPFPVPEEVFMVYEIREGSLDRIDGKVVYPPAFNSVS